MILIKHILNVMPRIATIGWGLIALLAIFFFGCSSQRKIAEPRVPNYAVLDTIPTIRYWHTHLQPSYHTYLPAISSGLPYAVLQAYDRLDSLELRIFPTAILNHRYSHYDSLYDTLAYSDWSRSLLKYSYIARDYNPMLSAESNGRDGRFNKHILRTSPDTVWTWALAASDLILRVRIVDTASTFDNKFRWTAAIAKVLDTIKGRVLPPPQWHAKRPFPNADLTRGGYTSFQTANPASKKIVEPGKEYIVFLNLVGEPNGTYTVEPSSLMHKTLLFPIENGYMHDSANVWGLGTAPRVEDFLRLLHEKIHAITHYASPSETAPRQTSHYGVFDTIPSIRRRFPNSGLPYECLQASIRLDSLSYLPTDDEYQYLTDSDTSRQITKNFLLLRGCDPVAWAANRGYVAALASQWFPDHILETYPDSTQDWALASSDYIFHVRVEDTAREFARYLTGEATYSEVLADVLDTIKGRVFIPSAGLATSNSRYDQEGTGSKIAFCYDPQARRFSLILENGWRAALRTPCLDPPCGPGRGSVVGDMNAWVKPGKEYVVFLEYKQVSAYHDSDRVYVLEPIPQGYSPVNYVYPVDHGHVQDPANEWGTGTSPTTETFISAIRKKIYTLTHP